MSWEKTDDWPDGRNEGGAFRGAAEVILARREAPSGLQRLRTWWHSTPELPFKAMPMRVVLTQSWLYVESRNGERRRVRLEQVRGSRREAKRVIYAIADGEDLVIADCGGDALERALDEHAGTTGEWRSGGAFATVTIAALIGLAFALYTVFYYRDEAVQEIREWGMWDSEAALGLYAGLGGVLLVLLFTLFFPQRYVADALGLTSVRGLFGIVKSTIPVERLTGVVADFFITRNQKSGRTYTHHFVDVQLRDPSQVKRVFLAAGGTVGKLEDKRAEAKQIARRLAFLYDIELTDKLN